MPRSKKPTAKAAAALSQQESPQSDSNSGENVAVELDQLDLRSEDGLKQFVCAVHKSVEATRSRRLSVALRAALEESRDVVLNKAREEASSKTKTTLVYPRLPSNSTAPPTALADLFCMPCGVEPVTDATTCASSAAAAGSSTGSVIVKVRTATKRSFQTQVAKPPLYLEGTHPPRPPSTATAFLRSHYATEDEKSLKYVPYFGDDDKEDCVSELFDIDHRANMVEFGPEYQERDMNDEVDEMLQEIIKLAGDRIHKKSTPQKSGPKNKKTEAEIIDKIEHDEDIMKQMVAIVAKLSECSVERVNERYDLMMKGISSQESKSSSEGGGKSDGNRKSSSNSSASSSASASLSYADVMDSYRNLFCRRCFTYDCNMHGNLAKPDIDLQAELAIQRQKDGYWEKSDTDLPLEDLSSASKGEKRVAKKSPKRKRSRASATESLTPDQKSLCKRVMMMFQGDIDKMANAMGADRNAVEQYVNEMKLTLEDPVLLPKESRKRKDAASEYTSMKNYNVNWLNNIQNAVIHPAFIPCDHDGLCNETNCSCVQNAFFCTKHCIWGARSRNFFRGCACKGVCNTNSCCCFAAKRECDPDLCRHCGACCDPPNKPATTQRCKNDSLSMRRHAHLLVAESTIPDAGWGLFTKHALKKGDFVHEYVGEVISQEEAERRGRIYDKVNRSYLFNLCSDFVVDASRKGNKTKYINHSSKPNCITKMVTVNGDPRIGLFAKCDIEAQSELFFDYRYDVGMDNDLIIKPARRVDWMNDPKMANKVSREYATSNNKDSSNESKPTIADCDQSKKKHVTS